MKQSVGTRPSAKHVDVSGRRRRAMSTYREDGVSLFKMRKETAPHCDTGVMRCHSTPEMEDDCSATPTNSPQPPVRFHFHGQWQRQPDGSPAFLYVQLDRAGRTCTHTRKFPSLMWEELVLYRLPVVIRRESVQWTRYEIEDNFYHSFAVCVTRPRIPVVATDRGYSVRGGCEYMVPLVYFQDAARRDWLVATQRELKRRRVVITHDDFWSTVEFSSPGGDAQFVHVDVAAPFLEYNEIDPVPYIHSNRQTYMPFCTSPSQNANRRLIPRSSSAEHFTRPSTPCELPKSPRDLDPSPRRSSSEDDEDDNLLFEN